jgi:hypothetical protein
VFAANVSCPILSLSLFAHVLSKFFLLAFSSPPQLLLRMKSDFYVADSPVASSREEADRLMIIVTGTVRFQVPNDRGEFAYCLWGWPHSGPLSSWSLTRRGTEADTDTDRDTDASRTDRLAIQVWARVTVRKCSTA